MHKIGRDSYEVLECTKLVGILMKFWNAQNFERFFVKFLSKSFEVQKFEDLKFWNIEVNFWSIEFLNFWSLKVLKFLKFWSFEVQEFWQLEGRGLCESF